MTEPRLIIVTGVMAAGKSTVAQALAQRFDRGVHLRGDQYRRAIVSGRHEMSSTPTPEALEQLRLRYRLAVTSAETYVEAGYTTVLQDTIIGPMLGDVVAMVGLRPLAVVVLAPDPEEVQRREHGRAKTGYTSFTPHQLDRILRTETPGIGYWLDTTELTVAQTVENISRELGTAALVA